MAVTQVCAWCRVTISNGAVPGEVSHGVCPSCAAELLAELEAQERDLPLASPPVAGVAHTGRSAA